MKFRNCPNRSSITCCVQLFATLLFFHSCTPDGEGKRFVIAFSQCVGNDAWRETMLDEMKRELSFYPEIGFLYRDAGGDNEMQIRQIGELLDADIDLLIVSPNEAEPLTPIVDSVFRQNIPVIVTDRKTASGLYNAYVGADNTAIGRLAGQYIGHLLDGRGDIAVITGLKGSSASIEREAGLRETLREHPEIRVSTVLPGDWERKTAHERAKKHAAALKDKDLIFAFNDQMAIGVREALAEPGVPGPKIIGVDALPGGGNGLEEIIQGRLFASMLYPTGGTEAIRTAIAILEKRPYKRENILGTLVINGENAEPMVLQSNKIREQQQDIDKRQKLIAEQAKIYNHQRATLNMLVAGLAFVVVLGGVSVTVIRSNWEKNRHLEEQNREILAQQQQIMDMNKRIQEVSEAKGKFFANVSHEFKTPLTLILAPLEELETEKGMSPAGKEQLARIRRNAKKLQHLVADLIDIHRMDRSKPRLQAAPVRVGAFVRQVLAGFKPLAQKKRIALSYAGKTSREEIWLDEYLMEQALSNLLSNAFKYTPPGGKIEVVAEENTFGDHLHIRVMDNGAGISPADIDHVFDAFYQGSGHLGGSGIGLSYVREIVELHHGQVTVSSRPGAGSSFTMRLPVGDAHLSAEEVKKPDSTVNRTPLSIPVPEDFEDGFSGSDDGPPVEEVAFHSDRASDILVVDDHADIRGFLKKILEREYNVFFAPTYREALQRLEKTSPDLIISDIMLPDGSGLDLLQSVKDSPRTSQIPVLLLSALDAEETKIEGMKRMADAYLTKPFSVGRLRAVIENLIRSRKQMRERYSSLVEPLTHEAENGRTDRDRRFLQHLSLVVEARLGDCTLSIEDVAEELNMSRVQLYRKTKSLLDQSVNEYILQRRLKKSKHLILEGLNINEVADRVGFSSAAYYAAAFKKQFGETPTAFRKLRVEG